MSGGEGKSRKRRSSASSGVEEERERKKRRDKKESRRSSPDGRGSGRGKDKEKDSKESRSKEKEKSKRKDKHAASVLSPCSAAARPEACSDPEVYTKIAGYVEVAREMYGADYDPSQHDLDPEVVIRAGGGKKHDRYYMGEGTIGPITTPNLAQIRARSTSSSASIHTRPESARQEMKALAEEICVANQPAFEQMKQRILQDMEQFIPQYTAAYREYADSDSGHNESSAYYAQNNMVAPPPVFNTVLLQGSPQTPRQSDHGSNDPSSSQASPAKNSLGPSPPPIG